MRSTKEEFLKVLSNYQGILHKVSLVYFKNKPDREDNLQEIIYQLWKSFPGIRNHSSIGSWIYAVSINTSISRINLLSKWLTGRYKSIEFFLFPVLFILANISIHIYYTGLHFIEVFQSDKFLKEDMWGMIIFMPIVIAVGFYVLSKIRKYHMKNLQFLVDLRDRLSDLC